MRFSLSFILLTLFLSLSITACDSESSKTDESEGPLRLIINTSGINGELMRELAGLYEEETGEKVVIVDGSDNATELFTIYQTLLGSRSSSIDIYQIDIIWPGAFSDHLLTVDSIVEGEREDFFPELLRNNTINSRLVAVPWYTDGGLLYYRQDLIEEYGYDSPPETWEELEEMAGRIQEGEREKGNSEFWGYCWQGDDREALTCNALEWQRSMGGGMVVDASGSLSINREKTGLAFDRAASWLGSISPPKTVSMAETASLRLYQSGQSAFMRNWAVFFKPLQIEAPEIAGNTRIAPLPAGESGRSATLGGWQLAISRYSERPEAAMRFVQWLTSPEAMQKRALSGSYMPARRSVYDAPEILKEKPWMTEVRDAIENGHARPSTVTRDLYNEVSTAYYSAVHDVLTGEIDSEQATIRIEQAVLIALARVPPPVAVEDP